MAIVFNPMDPEFLADPYPMYHRLRTEDPVHHSPLGFWILTRYDDVVAVLRDPRLAKEALAAFVAARFGTTVPPGLGMSMLDRDPPDHTRLRSLVSKAFTPRVVEVLRPHIQQIVDGLLAAVQDDHEMDLIEQFAYPLPVIVICEMLGVPVADHERFKGWGLDIARGLDTTCCRRTPRWASAAWRPAARWPTTSAASSPSAGRPAERPALRPHRGRGARRPAERGRADRHLHPAARRRSRDHGQPHRQRHAGPAAPSGTSCGALREDPTLDRQRGRGAAALRRSGAADGAHPERGRRASAAGPSARARS